MIVGMLVVMVQRSQPHAVFYKIHCVVGYQIRCWGGCCFSHPTCYPDHIPDIHNLLSHPKARAASLSAELAQIKDRWDLLRIIPVSCETGTAGGFHSHGALRWMVYFMENPIYNWMMTGGTPTSGNHHVFKEAPGAAECRCRASSCRGGSNRGGAVRSGDREERTRGPLRGGCQTQRGQMFGLYAIQCRQSSTFFFFFFFGGGI